MNDDRITEISNRLKANAYFINPHSDTNVKQDIEYLVGLMAEKDKKIAQLEKKSSVLMQQVMELTQELENSKSDFGGTR